MENNNITLYKKGCVYKLFGVSDDGAEIIYIGSTVNALSNRKAIHKYHYKKNIEGGFPKCSSFDVFHKCKSVKIEPIETIIDCSREQLRELENKYINQFQCVNIKSAHNSADVIKENARIWAKKYYYANHEKELAKKKEYYWKNKELIKDKNNEHYRKNKERIKEYQREYQREYNKKPEVKERMRLYRLANKEKAKEYHKKYYEKNQNKNIRHINNE